MPRDSKGRFTAAVEIQVVDNSTSWIRRIARSFGDITKAGKAASKSFSLSADMKQAAENVTGFANDMASVIRKPIKTYTDFEEQISSVKAATFDLTKSMDAKSIGEMDAAMAKMSATARQLGSDSEKFGASDVAAGMDVLSKNFGGEDLKKAQDVMDAMPGILDAATALKGSIEQTADIGTATMSQFGLAATDMNRIGDVLVKTANNSATGLEDLGEALKYSGVTAKAANIDLETTMGMLGALGNAGKKGSMAGTGLSSVLGNMQSGMKKQRSALAALGINVKDKNGNLRPIIDLLTEIDKAADKKFGGDGKGGVRRDRWLQGLVGMGSDKEVLGILTQQAGSGELQKMVEMNKNAAGAAAKVAAEMSNNTAGAARELDSTLEELQLTIGEEVIPMVVDLLKWAKEATSDFTDWAKENKELVKGIVLVVGALAGIGLVAGPVLRGAAAVNTLISLVRVASAVMMANPILAVIGAIALAAYLIYDNWDAVSEFFKKHWKAIAIVFAPIMPLLAPFIAAGKLIMDNWEPIKKFFIDLWDTVTGAFKKAMDWILDKIKWVGEKIEAFSISVMSADEAAAYASEKEAEAAANAKAVFGDDDDYDPNSMNNRENRFAGPASNDAMYSLDAMKESLANWMPQGAANGPIAQGPALLSPEQASTSNFSGDLKITVDSEGKVSKTQMRSSGDPNFAVRMNAGGQ